MKRFKSAILPLLLVANLVVSGGVLWYVMQTLEMAENARDSAEEAGRLAADAKQSADQAFEAADRDASAERLGRILQQNAIEPRPFMPPGVK